MVRRYYELPSLTALAVFEATARHKSFKLAADELNVTTGAISRQIKAVEDEIGTPVFIRSNVGVQLTPAGEELYSVLAHSFARASETVQRIKRGQGTKSVTLACTNAFATMWLMPRMGEFWRQYPELLVDHMISDNARDFRRAEVDLRIRYGFGAWSDESACLLLQERIYPVCGMAFARRHQGVKASDLPKLPLIHVDRVDPDWTGWDEMLRRAGIQHGPLSGRRFNNFTVALQATQEDQGVAIGWHQLVKAPIHERKLRRLTDLEMSAPGSYYLTWNENRDLSPAAETLKSWLIAVAAREPVSRDT